MLALATCFCNDIFREAGSRGIEVREVAVEATGEFPAAGSPASDIEYRASVTADCPEDAIRELVEHTDTVAEIHLTLRKGIAVRRSQ